MQPRIHYLLPLLAWAACGSDQNITRSNIIDGTPASDYPASCYINFTNFAGQPTACSGALIAPAVVLTAGHCAGAGTGFTVTFPYLGISSVPATAEAHPGYIPSPAGEDVVETNSVDIGLAYLQQLVPMTRYPPLRSTPLPDGSLVVNVGRTLNATVTSALYAGAPVKVYPSDMVSLPGGLVFPWDYVSTDIIQGGDSGGPTYFDTTAGPEIVAANSGSDSTINYQILARTDLVFPWIAARVNAHGSFQWPTSAQPVLSQPLPIEQ